MGRWLHDLMNLMKCRAHVRAEWKRPKDIMKRTTPAMDVHRALMSCGPLAQRSEF
jgi:hypothetical protein